MAGFERFFRLYLLFAVFVLPLVFLQRCEEAYYLPKLAVLPGILPLVVFLKGIKPEKYDYLILGFLFFYAAGFFNGVSFFDVLSGLASWAAVITAYFYIKYRAAGSYREKLILSAAASAVLVAAYSVMQAFKLDLEGWASDFSGRAFSSLGNPDFLGGFLVIMIPAGFYIAAGLGRVKTGTAVFYFLITALILSQTRSSLIAAGCAAGLLVLFFREFFFRKALKINITAFVLAALVITASGAAGGLSGRIADAVTMKSADLSGRVKMWGIGAKMAAENPVFGMGAGAVKTNYHKFAGGGRYYETDRLHNDYIDMAASSGIPAAVLFILFIGVSGARLLREKGVFPRIFTAALAGTAIHAFFNFPFFIPDTQLYF
ncbi:MAG TPA: O-antigen ligase domain-containing protein, partial [bacterium]|nr:O-antigen ligase domain-containing protein [bacterium]